MADLIASQCCSLEILQCWDCQEFRFSSEARQLPDLKQGDIPYLCGADQLPVHFPLGIVVFWTLLLCLSEFVKATAAKGCACIGRIVNQDFWQVRALPN